ncbi:MAG: LPS biosynthesis choline kinase, partial [Nocardioides sp.]
VRLQAVVSAYGWSLWGFIQAAASDLDYDFRQWGLHRYHKAVRAMTGPGFEALLDAVAHE